MHWMVFMLHQFTEEEMKRSLSCRIIACFVILTIGTLHVFAEKPSAKIGTASGRAFLRGGSAISEALNERTTTTETIVPPKRAASEQPPLPEPAPQTTEG